MCTIINKQIFWEGIIAIGIQMPFRIQEGSYIPVSLSTHELIIFGKNRIGIK